MLSYLLRWVLQVPAEVVATVPFGPLVEPLTCPLPAVIVVDKPPAEARPWLVATQVEPRPLPVTTVLLEPPELLLLTEPPELLLLTLTELCASAVEAPRPNSAMDTRKVFKITTSHCAEGHCAERNERLRGRDAAQPIVTVRYLCLPP